MAGTTDAGGASPAVRYLLCERRHQAVERAPGQCGTGSVDGSAAHAQHRNSQCNDTEDRSVFGTRPKSVLCLFWSGMNVDREDRPIVGIVIGQLTHGGAERQCFELAKGMCRNGILDPVVFCTSQETEPYGALLTALGIEWVAAPSGRRRGIDKLLWLLRAVSKSHCGLLYGMLHTGNVYAGFAALLLRLPFVASIRLASKPALPVRLTSAFACRRAAVVASNSPSAARSLENDIGVRHHPRVVVIPNCVRAITTSPVARAKIRRKLEIPADAFVVGTMANLKAQKRPSFFLAVCEHVHDAWQQRSATPALPHFIWLGDGVERIEVAAALALMSNDLRSHIHFPGAFLDADAYLSAFDAFVLTSAYEGMPNALLEAMAAGLPCVATDVQGTCDVLNAAPDLGILADAQDPGKFAEQLIALLADRERMRVLGDNARSHVREHHSMDQMIKAYTAVFLEALERRRGH
jgi:glycosyltransferase involved in cell wall biosynthesis